MSLAWIGVAAGLLATPAAAQQGLAMVQAMDRNGDGAITRAEAEGARAAMFDRLDADHDGFISAAERSAAQGQRRRGLERVDTDNDGRISRAEMMNQPYRGFDRLDDNNDDVVSADELEAARTLMQGGR